MGAQDQVVQNKEKEKESTKSVAKDEIRYQIKKTKIGQKQKTLPEPELLEVEPELLEVEPIVNEDQVVQNTETKSTRDNSTKDKKKIKIGRKQKTTLEPPPKEVPNPVTDLEDQMVQNKEIEKESIKLDEIKLKENTKKAKSARKPRILPEPQEVEP